MTREPMSHYQNWFQSKHELPPMLEFVTEKSDEFEAEFSALLHDDHQDRWANLSGLFEDNMVPPEWVEVGVVHGIEMFTDYFRRAALNTKKFPALMCWLVYSPPAECCRDRQECARHMLGLREEESALASWLKSDATTFKVIDLFKDELESAADHGRLHPRLFELLWDVVTAWGTDTQFVEGMNKRVKNMCKISPFISWKLLAARLSLKSYLLNGASRETHNQFVAACVCNHGEAKAHAARSSRWDVVRCSDAEREALEPPSKAKPILGHAELEAGKVVAIIKRGFAAAGIEFSPTAKVAISPVPLEAEDGTLWIPSLKHYSRLWVVKGSKQTMHLRGRPHIYFQLELPLKAKPLLQATVDTRRGLINQSLSSNVYHLLWDMGSKNRASIVGRTELVGPTKTKQRKRKKGDDDSAAAHDEGDDGLLREARGIVESELALDGRLDEADMDPSEAASLECEDADEAELTTAISISHSEHVAIPELGLEEPVQVAIDAVLNAKLARELAVRSCKIFNRQVTVSQISIHRFFLSNRMLVC